MRVRLFISPLAEKLSQGASETTFRFSPTSLEKAWIGGNLVANTLPAGKITGMLQDVQPVWEIIEEMVNQVF